MDYKGFDVLVRAFARLAPWHRDLALVITGPTIKPAPDLAHLVEHELRLIDDDVGYGVFATAPIPRGTVTWTLCRLDIVFTPIEAAALPAPYRPIIDKYAYGDADGNLILCWDNARFINHSCKPNCETEVTRGRIWVRARRSKSLPDLRWFFARLDQAQAGARYAYSGKYDGEGKTAEQIVAIARAIVHKRPLHTTRELVAVIEAVSPRRGDRIHPATRTFQALRIAVNDELASIREVLPQAVASLSRGGAPSPRAAGRSRRSSCRPPARRCAPRAPAAQRRGPRPERRRVRVAGARAGAGAAGAPYPAGR